MCDRAYTFDSIRDNLCQLVDRCEQAFLCQDNEH